MAVNAIPKITKEGVPSVTNTRGNLEKILSVEEIRKISDPEKITFLTQLQRELLEKKPTFSLSYTTDPSLIPYFVHAILKNQLPKELDCKQLSPAKVNDKIQAIISIFTTYIVSGDLPWADNRLQDLFCIKEGIAPLTYKKFS